MPEQRVTIKIPRSIYERIREITDESSFNSVTDFVVYVLRDVVSETALPDDDRSLPGREATRAVRQRLKKLGDL